MNNKSFRKTRKVVLAATLLLLYVVNCVAEPIASTLPPLNAEEFSAVKKEIEYYWHIENYVETNNFLPKEASPKRIDRLFSMPEFLKEPKGFKQHAISLAGQSSVLLFNKPSDIIKKVSTWFPHEIEEALTKEDRTSFTYIPSGLHGPVSSWNDEPAAFVSLWKCMPLVAWLSPNKDPFLNFIPSTSLKAMYGWELTSTQNTTNFGGCIRTNSLNAPADPWVTESNVHELNRRMGERVTLVLNSKFSQFLTKNRCRGTGPDDCTLIFALWADLVPKSPDLARVLQLLESDVDLYYKSNQIALSIVNNSDDSKINAIRDAVFLRAKLLSILDAPTEWPSNALSTLMQKITISWEAEKNRCCGFDLVQQNLYALKNEFLHETSYPSKFKSAMLAELDHLSAETPCNVIKNWFELSMEGDGNIEHSPLRVVYQLNHPASKSFECGLNSQNHQFLRIMEQGEWAWLVFSNNPEAVNLRSGFIKLLNQDKFSSLTEEMLTNFASNNSGCSSRREEEKCNLDWLAPFLNLWIQEPQRTPLQLVNSHTGINEKNKFTFKHSYFRMPEDSTDYASAQQKWLMSVVQDLGENTVKQMDRYFVNLKVKNIVMHDAKIWRSPRNTEVLILLNGDSTENKLFLAKASELTEIHIPSRFSRSGYLGGVMRVSDVDDDGNPEVWLTDSSACHKDASDFDRELDCSAKEANMGEIRGDTLTYFINSKSTEKLKPLTASNRAHVPEPEGLFEPPEKSQKCNNLLIGRTLSKVLPIDFGGGKENKKRGEYGDVIDLVCETHPLHPDQVIVALLYYLKDDQGNYLDENSSEVTKGFAMAVIDKDLQKVQRLAKKPLVEDALTRADSGSVHIDISDFDTVKSTKEIRIIMDIAWCPRSLNCTGTSLSLFFEDGDIKVYNTELVGGDPG